MSETKSSSTPEQQATSSSNSNNRKKNKGKQKGKGKVNVAKSKWKGATADLGEDKVFALKNELGSDRQVSYKVTVEAAEVFAAVKFPKSAKIMSHLFKDPPRNPSIADPPKPVGDDRKDTLMVQLYLEEAKRAASEKTLLENALHGMFTILWGQCSPGVQAKVRANPLFALKKEQGECAWLLDTVRQLMYSFTASKYPPHSTHLSTMELLQYRQAPGQSLMVYYDRFKDRVHAAEYSKVSIGTDEATRAFAAKEIEELRDLDPGPPPVIPDLPDLSGLVAKDPFSLDDDVEEADSKPRAIKADTDHIENDLEAVKKEEEKEVEMKKVDGSDSDHDGDPSDEFAVPDASVMS